MLICQTLPLSDEVGAGMRLVITQVSLCLSLSLSLHLTVSTFSLSGGVGAGIRLVIITQVTTHTLVCRYN